MKKENKQEDKEHRRVRGWGKEEREMRDRRQATGEHITEENTRS